MSKLGKILYQRGLKEFSRAIEEGLSIDPCEHILKGKLSEQAATFAVYDPLGVQMVIEHGADAEFFNLIDHDTPSEAICLGLLENGMRVEAYKPSSTPYKLTNLPWYQVPLNLCNREDSFTSSNKLILRCARDVRVDILNKINDRYFVLSNPDNSFFSDIMDEMRWIRDVSYCRPNLSNKNSPWLHIFHRILSCDPFAMKIVVGRLLNCHLRHPTLFEGLISCVVTMKHPDASLLMEHIRVLHTNGSFSMKEKDLLVSMLSFDT